MKKVLKRLLLKTPPIESESLEDSQFIGKVNQIFEQYDNEREMLERSLMLSSEELNKINSQLKVELNNKKNYQHQLETTLVEQNTIINSVPDAILNFTSDGSLKHINNAGCDFLNITQEELSSITLNSCLTLIFDKVLKPKKFISIIQKIQKDNTLKIKGYISTVDDEFYEYYSAPGFINGVFIGRVWCFKNITDMRKNEQQLHFQAYHDELTTLPNRALLIETIEHAISFTNHSHEQIAILFLDLDDFKKINDTLGHQQGDKFLIDIATRIKSTLSNYDVLGRLSGDEFLIVLEGILKPCQIIDVHTKISALFTQPFTICGNQYTVSCSIGISTFPQDGDNSDVLIRKADMAMYQAKKNGKNRVHYFDSQLEKIALTRIKVENEIREAIDNELFVFHYQPKINLVSNKLLGVEALVRIQKVDGELMFPDAFISIAEESGLIRDITKVLIKQVCQTLKEWQTTHLKGVSIAINITAIDFSQYNFVSNLLTQITNAGVEPHLLQLEITESVLMDDIKNVMSVINELKQHNISVAIDDFGTGYSSFSYLHDLDVDYIKIDKSFIQNVYKTQKSKAIVKSIIDLGINLDIKVIAEGVETINEHEFLCENNCHIGQGYYYNRPLTKDQLFDVSSKNT